MGKTAKDGRKKRWKHIFNPQWFVLDFAKITAWISFALFFRTKIYYETPLANNCPKGRAIILANHPSIWEPPVMVHAFFTRRLRFLTNKIIYKNRPFFGWVLNKAGCIGLDKERFDMESIHSVIRALDNDELVCIFPEGALSDTDDLLPFKSGAVMMALRTGAPILPVYIKKTAKLWNRKKMIIGEAIEVQACFDTKNPSMKQIDEVSAMLYHKLDQLKGQLARCENNLPPLSATQTHFDNKRESV